MQLSVERGLEKARALDVGVDGNTGYLQLGFDAALSGVNSGYAFGTIDYLQKVAQTPVGELSAFAKGFGGAIMSRGKWESEMGVTAGFGLSW